MERLLSHRVKPRPIPRGSYFSVAAPSSQVNEEFFAAGEKKLSRFGFGLAYTKQIFASHRFYAGDDETRLSSLMGELEREDTHAIWCARGGYGALRLLSALDQAETRDRLRANPKLLIGYSDASALHSYFWSRAGIPGLHAPLMATPSWLKMKRPAAEAMFDWLAGKAPLGKKSYSATWPTRHLATAREAEGIILGGNLAVLTSLLGTPWQPNFEGALLLLEDCNEAPYRLDRMLAQMDAAGLFKGLAGVLAGDLAHDVPKEFQKKVSWKQVLLDRFSDVPVIGSLPIGHGSRNEALPLGVRGRITRAGKLEVLEQLVSPANE